MTKREAMAGITVAGPTGYPDVFVRWYEGYVDNEFGPMDPWVGVGDNEGCPTAIHPTQVRRIAELMVEMLDLYERGGLA